MSKRSTISFRVEGHDLHPHTLDVRFLAELMSGVANAVQACVDAGDLLLGEGMPVVSLVGVRDECALIELTTPPTVDVAMQEVIDGVAGGDLTRLPRGAQEHLLRVHRVLQTRGATAALYRSTDGMPADAMLGGERAPTVAERRAHVRGGTDVVGTCYLLNLDDRSARMRVEGATRYVQLRRIDPEDDGFRTALGTRIRVTGTATWDPNDDWTLRELEMASWEPASYDPDAIIDAARERPWDTPDGVLPSELILAARRERE